MDFDTLVHQPTRLQLFAYLYRYGESSFSEIVEELDMTEGNLASHMNKLEDADCVAVEKQFVDGSPQTTYRLTDHGREKFEEHVGQLEALIESLEE
ncbi:Transcriptional regulator, MarR family [Halorhabdus sp. SVX81]|uniref:transcriptional regulator n=1 Tax=Halorhabdus sp. SVX81 TaxID=2978283 RepID=UPI0023DC235B|nr:transcriptional regulator [Halorhabdus sp. SVX81]WEL16914.1 Transcriptional regulator, MarR family [Halorhabdus sp. SVX81]